LAQSPPDALIDALLREAEAGGAGALKAARTAAALAERVDPSRVGEALRIAIRLDPRAAEPRLDLARLLAERGDLEAARAEAAVVLKDSPDEAARGRAAFILGELARAGGDPAQARGHYETALRIEDGLLAVQRSDPAAARWYARARGRLAELDASDGAFARALAGAEGALAMLRASAAQIGEPPELAADIADAELRLGALELDDNRAASARRRLREAIGRYEALAVTEADEPHWRAVLSDAWALAAEADYVRGAPADARAAMDKALQARLKLAAAYPHEVWALAGLWRVRAALLAALKDNQGAADSLAQARTIAVQLAADGAEAPTRFLVQTLLDEADHGLRTGVLATARDCADAARQRAEAQALKESAHPTWFGETAACWDRLGEVARAASVHDKAHDAFARATELRRMALAGEPESARVKRALAAALLKLGDAALEANAPASARVALNESVALRTAFLAAAPKDEGAARALAVALERLGLAAFAGGEKGAARSAWESELALAEQIFRADTIEATRFRAIAHAHLAGLNESDSNMHRRNALLRFDALAQSGVLTVAEAALRRKLLGERPA
jgi:tetratricopeptide (TPR) repeat protein